MSNRYSETAMIVDLTLGHWKPVKRSKKLGKELADLKETVEEAVTVGKKLFPWKPTPPSYLAVTSGFAGSYNFHNEQTLPWNNDGGRILLSANHMDYNNGMRKWRRTCETAWLVFQADLPNLKEQSRAISNGIFDEADWPDAKKLVKSFKFKIEFFPFPDAADFRVDISELEMRSLREAADEGVQERVEAAMRDLYGRLLDPIKHMVDRLNSDSEDIHSSVVENIRKQIALIPKLNLTGDQRIFDFAEEIEAGLTRFTGDQLSAKSHLRTTVLARAEEIAGELEERVAA